MLGAAQRSFKNLILDEDLPLPPVWDAKAAAGMAIYRNAYRLRIVGALGETFCRTQRWVGAEPFGQAATHYTILQPPSSWSLDHIGAGFPALLEDLFRNDPEVAELARLEWQMNQLYVAKDAQPLDQSAFAAAVEDYSEADWANLTLELMPGLAIEPVRTDCAAIWRALTDNTEMPQDVILKEASALIVWRENFRCVFRSASSAEAHALSLAGDAASFAAICDAMVIILGEERAASETGTMLGRWVQDGMIAGIAEPSSDLLHARDADWT